MWTTMLPYSRSNSSKKSFVIRLMKTFQLRKNLCVTHDFREALKNQEIARASILPSLIFWQFCQLRDIMIPGSVSWREFYHSIIWGQVRCPKRWEFRVNGCGVPGKSSDVVLTMGQIQMILQEKKNLSMIIYSDDQCSFFPG